MTRLRYWGLVVKLWLKSLFAPWATIRDLREENARLVETVSSPLLTGINIGNGTLDFGLEGGAAQLMAGMFVGMFEKYPDAKNYLEVRFGSHIGGIVVTVQKELGKTPHQLLTEVRQELAAALAAQPGREEMP